MTVFPPISPRPDPVQKVDGSRGERLGRVSSEWFSRPDDERPTARTVETKALCVEASRDDFERLIARL